MHLHFVRLSIAVAALLEVAVSAYAADDVVEAIDQARKSYQAGDLSGAKQQLDLASQLIGQKNAEVFSKLLPQPLPGWTAEKAQAQAVGSSFGGASAASRNYTNAKGDTVDVSITGDSAVLMQFATITRVSRARWASWSRSAVSAPSRPRTATS